MLLGRAAEQRRVDDLLTAARRGRSAVLVVRGEPGIGKSALLDYARQGAAEMTVIRCRGIEAERALAFAARRLEAEPIALLAATRLGAPTRLDGAGLPELELGALDDTVARALLEGHLDRRAAPHVVDTLVA